MKARLWIGVAILLGSMAGWLASHRLDSDLVSPIAVTAETRPRYRDFFFRRGSRLELVKHIGVNHDRVKEPFREVIAEANVSTVRLYSNGNQVALGVVVSPDGRILTKASELHEPLTCRLPGGREYDAQILVQSGEADLALVKIEAQGLKVGSFVEAEMPTGSWIAIPGGKGDTPIVVGVISGKPRRISEERAILGVMLAESADGPRIDHVLERSIAAQIGLETGDVIRAINSKPLTASRHLVDLVAGLRPGDRVQLDVLRQGEAKQLEARLGRISELMFAESEFERELDRGLSVRRSGFPKVLQHDGTITARECGGPLVNVRGQIVGLNIARSGRVATYALPASLIQAELRRLTAKIHAPGPMPGTLSSKSAS